MLAETHDFSSVPRAVSKGLNFKAPGRSETGLSRPRVVPVKSLVTAVRKASKSS